MCPFVNQAGNGGFQVKGPLGENTMRQRRLALRCLGEGRRGFCEGALTEFLLAEFSLLDVDSTVCVVSGHEKQNEVT
jgi:hypothetical protein